MPWHQTRPSSTPKLGVLDGRVCWLGALTSTLPCDVPPVTALHAITSTSWRNQAGGIRKSALATAEARRGGGRRIGRAQHLAVDLKQYAEDCVQLRRSRKTRGLVAFTLNGNTNAGAVGPPCTGTKVPVTSASSSSCTTTRAEGGSIRAQPANGTASAHAVVTGRSQHATLARTTKLLTVANASALSLQVTVWRYRCRGRQHPRSWVRHPWQMDGTHG